MSRVGTEKIIKFYRTKFPNYEKVALNYSEKVIKISEQNS